MNLGLEDYGSDADSDNDNDNDNDNETPKLKLTPKPSNVKAKRPKKISIGLPTLTAEADEDLDERPPAKKPRLGSGAGSSSLLSMLPAPKQKAPILPPPERVLGGGRGPGLVFNMPVETTGESESDPTSSAFLLPPSLKKGRANISLEESSRTKPAPPLPPSAPVVDFFSLGPCSLLCPWNDNYS